MGASGGEEFGEFVFWGGLNVGHECPAPEGEREIHRTKDVRWKTVPRPRRSARGAQNALRDPTRQTTARHKESGRSARDDSGEKGGPLQKDGPYSGGRNTSAIRENGDPRAQSSFQVRS
jgi:hypothetical protein